MEQGFALYDSQKHKHHAFCMEGMIPEFVVVPLQGQSYGSSAIQIKPCKESRTL